MSLHYELENQRKMTARRRWPKDPSKKELCLSISTTGQSLAALGRARFVTAAQGRKNPPGAALRKFSWEKDESQ